jgi:hypothetical protein
LTKEPAFPSNQIQAPPSLSCGRLQQESDQAEPEIA